MEEITQQPEHQPIVPFVKNIQIDKKIGRPPNPPKEKRPYTVNPILTQDAFKVPREEFHAACERDKAIAMLAKAIERRRRIMTEGKRKRTERRSKFCQAQARLMNILRGKIFKRKAAIRKKIRIKIIQKAAKEFARRCQDEGLAVR